MALAKIEGIDERSGGEMRSAIDLLLLDLLGGARPEPIGRPLPDDPRGPEGTT